MLTHNQIQVRLLRRMAILIDNDRALFENEMEPQSNEDSVAIQERVDGFIRELKETASTIECMTLGRSLRECRMDIESPPNE